MKQTQLKRFAALTACGLIALTGCSADSAATLKQTNTATATIGNLQLGLVADGRSVLPVTSLNFEVSGTVSKIYVETGQLVETGDLLAELDDSDYQLAITNATNNLEKAEVSYNDAVNQHKFSLTNSEKNLESLKNKLNEPFDSYSYDTSISDAETTLERKAKELAEAEKEAADAFDDYTYKNTIEEAEINVSRKQKELDEAEKTLAGEGFTQVYDAKLSLERKQKELDDAIAGKPLDTYSYELAITDAQTNLNRKKTELEDAEKAARGKASDANSNQAAINEAKIKLERKKTELSKAQKVLNDTQGDIYSYETYSQYEAAVDKAQSDYDRLVEEVDDAQRSYDKTYIEADKTVDTLRESVSDAEKQLEKAEKDLERALETSGEDTETRIETLKTNLDDAQTAFEKALNDAEKNVENAKTSLADAERSLKKSKSDMERASKTSGEDVEKRLETARDSHSDAEKALEKAKTSLERAKLDHQKSMKETQTSYDLALMSYNNDKESDSSILNASLNVDDAKSSLTEAQNRLNKVRVYAPSDGKVLNISLKEGEAAAAKDNSGLMFFGTTDVNSNFITLCDVTEVFVKASISEADIDGIKLDQVVDVTIEALGEDSLYGTVYNVSSIPTTDSSGITTYEVTIRLDQYNPNVKDGMNALLNFIKKERNNVLLIPNKSVFIEDGKQYVNVVKSDGTYEKRAVVCGLSNGTQTEVASGLEEGEVVVNGKVN